MNIGHNKIFKIIFLIWSMINFERRILEQNFYYLLMDFSTLGLHMYLVMVSKFSKFGIAIKIRNSNQNLKT